MESRYLGVQEFAAGLGWVGLGLGGEVDVGDSQMRHSLQLCAGAKPTTALLLLHYNNKKEQPQRCVLFLISYFYKYSSPFASYLMKD
eukprot:scaffold424_cov165-Ochromonas_danica.AAC.5